MPLQETGSAQIGRRNMQPRRQEGSHQFEIVLPADKSKSGKEETVYVGFSRKVVATGPMNAADERAPADRWKIDVGESTLDAQALNRACPLVRYMRQLDVTRILPAKGIELPHTAGE